MRLRAAVAVLVAIDLLSRASCDFPGPGSVSAEYFEGQQDLSITEIIQKCGYPVEVHVIETEDGYLLETYRIPYGRKSLTNQPNRYPVMVNHGLMGSSENFIIGGPNKAITYMLADNGFDVWLMNARGSWHSRKHRYLDPDKDVKFWKFTWHEIGYYDIPNTIDYILALTKQRKVHYIGHSQGTTTFFAMGASRPEYNDKISVMVALAPSAILRNIRDPISKMLAPLYPQLTKIAESMKIYEMIPRQFMSNEGIRQVGKALCGENSTMRQICTNILSAMSLTPDEQIDPNTIPYIVAMGPGGASIYQAFHYAQILTKGKFVQYDWGPKENLRRYGSKLPPEYNLRNVTSPVALIYGKGDELITKEDVEILGRMLPNVVEVYPVPYDKWTHMDFVWGKDIDTYLHHHVIKLLYRFNDQ
ncbi:lipase 3-like [Cylas formicarius]|uniref:lipase 3-like n=1 Tax=Cylas formicarius TaxID=197179 RepID=UPI0029586AE9|nr:lipase 3-like [Cylas formicarius]